MDLLRHQSDLQIILLTAPPPPPPSLCLTTTCAKGGVGGGAGGDLVSHTGSGVIDVLRLPLLVLGHHPPHPIPVVKIPVVVDVRDLVQDAASVADKHPAGNGGCIYIGMV